MKFLRKNHEKQLCINSDTIISTSQNLFVAKKGTTDKKTESKGITLIALVISIVVLLILAGVTIATLTRRQPEL